MTTTTDPTPTTDAAHASTAPDGAQGGQESARPSTRPTDTPQNQPQNRTQGQRRYPRQPQLSEEERRARFEADMEATKTPENTWKALAIANLVTDQGVICPKCGKGPLPNGKFKVQPSSMYKHFSSEGCSGDPVSILQSVGIKTGDAVRVLLGKRTSTEIVIPELSADAMTRFTGVKSKIALDVFNGVLVYGQKTGGVEAAQEFYGTWHISPEAVEESGAVFIRDPKHFEKSILDRFGEEKLLECGLFTRTAKGDLYCLISRKFPVVEPHRHPVTGDVLYMQFRGSHEQYKRYLAHKADPEKVPYKGSEKIISLKGAPLAAQIGTGLERIEHLPAGSTIYVVEGFKDKLAVRTGSLEAYGLPGVGVKPPEKICQLLARHKVFVAYDGDEAGLAGMNGKTEKLEDGTERVITEGLVPYLRRHGVDAEAKVLFPGMDPTDILVSRHASGKATGVPCVCGTCVEFRAKNPQWFPATA